MPGRWTSIEQPDYQRLVHLARRRMIGLYEEDAEDAVSRALVKWTKITETKAGEARIEQVVRSESDSQVRSARRRLQRDHNATVDRGLSLQCHARPTDGVGELLTALLQTAKHLEVVVTNRDLEILLLLVAGYSMSAIEREFDIPRHQIRTSRRTWQVITSAMTADEEST